ncbi:hypothetical protein ACIP88_00575 [Streptomyces uncialis]|uniref:hypothetical protein n=1 Tax=Streptomyces uncialis TaxID=1048205 RepID=UPI003818E16F
MGWQTEEFGSSHEGRVGVVLADGTEPGPVYIDMGSGSHVQETTEWWVYDGRHGRPRAARVRGRCSCGWRGAGDYPVVLPRQPGQDPDLDSSGAYDDWSRHIDEVESRSVPLPVVLEELLDEVEEQLHALCAEAPLAALRAVAALERTTRRVGRDAAHGAQADDLSWETIGKALGLTEREARSRLTQYSIRR